MGRRTAGHFRLTSGRNEEALAAADKALALDASFAGSYFLLGSVYAQQARYAEAIEAWKKYISLGGDGGHGGLGYTYAVSGRRDEALQLLQELKTLRRGAERGLANYATALSIALVYVGLGDREQALDWLERGVETHWSMLYLAIEPSFRSLHAEPRFRALLKKMGLEE